MMQKMREFYDHVDLHRYKSILALNGDLPEKSFFENCNLPIIAADGAANALHQMGIKPVVIVGDLDSVDPKLLEHTPYEQVIDQSRCDFKKAFAFVQNADLLPTIIVGASGGFIDHILNNIGILMATGGGIFYSPPIVGHILKAESKNIFSLPIHTKISLMGATESMVSTHGLQWELNESVLSFTGNTSCFNRSVAREVSIEVHTGNCLVLIYLDRVH